MKDPIKNITPEEMVLQVKAFSKKEALNFLYRAGIVTKKGNYRKFYQGSLINGQSENKPISQQITMPVEIMQN